MSSPINKSNPVAEERSRLLESLANRLLRKAKFYPKRKSREFCPVDAESVSINGNLRPTWQGRP